MGFYPLDYLAARPFNPPIRDYRFLRTFHEIREVSQTTADIVPERRIEGAQGFPISGILGAFNLALPKCAISILRTFHEFHMGQ